MAWGIIKHAKASRKSICFCFKNIDSFINLLKQVVHIKVPSVLPCFEEHMSFTFLKG